MSYFGTTINDSPVIAGVAAAALSGAEFLAVKFDSSGKIAKASVAGEIVLGLLGAEEGDRAAGGTVSVQIKDGGLWKASGPIAAGKELTTDANGKCKEAGAGDYVLAIALESAAADGDVIKVQIVKAGYKPNASALTSVSLNDLSDVTLENPTNGQVLKYNGTKWANAADATE